MNRPALFHLGGPPLLVVLCSVAQGQTLGHQLSAPLRVDADAHRVCRRNGTLPKNLTHVMEEPRDSGHDRRVPVAARSGWWSTLAGRVRGGGGKERSGAVLSGMFRGVRRHEPVLLQLLTQSFRLADDAVFDRLELLLLREGAVYAGLVLVEPLQLIPEVVPHLIAGGHVRLRGQRIGDGIYQRLDLFGQVAVLLFP